MLPWLALATVLAGGIPARAQTLQLSSPDIAPGGPIAAPQVYDGHGCGGGNLSPALAWRGVPAGTRSLAVTIFDPDARAGHGWWHWGVFDLPPDLAGLPEGTGNPRRGLLPRGAEQARNDFGENAYDGPCPPPGPPHHYIITLYALDVARLAATPAIPAGRVAKTLATRTLARATLTGLYGR